MRHQEVVDMLRASNIGFRRMQADFAIDLSWQEIKRGIVPNLRAPLLGVLHREQRIGRYFHELRIAVISIAVGVSELEGLDERVNIVRRILLHADEVIAAQNIQRFNHRRAWLQKPGL